MRIVHPLLSPSAKPKKSHDSEIKLFRIATGQKFIYYKGKRYSIQINRNQGQNSSSFILRNKEHCFFLKLFSSLEHICFGLDGFAKIIDYGNAFLDGELLYFCLFEYIEGKTIFEYSRASKTVPDYVFYEILRIVGNANRAGLLLYDFNLENFMIDTSGRVTFIDYGGLVSLRHFDSAENILAIVSACSDFGIEYTLANIAENRFYIEIDILIECLTISEVRFESEELTQEVKAAYNKLLIQKESDSFKDSQLVKTALRIISQ